MTVSRLRHCVERGLLSEFTFNEQHTGRGVTWYKMWGDVLCRGSGGQKSSSVVQGRSPGRGSGGRSPPEAEAILDFYMHNFDLILTYFCFARATEMWHFI